MFLKWLMVSIILTLSITVQAESTCNIEPGIYVSRLGKSESVDVGLLFDPQKYSNDLRMTLKDRLMLTVDAKKQMSLAGFQQKEMAFLYNMPILGRFVDPPEIGRVEFSQLHSVCRGNLIVLSWLGREGDDAFPYSGIMKAYFDSRTNSVFSTLPQPNLFSIRFGSGDVKKQLLLKKLDITFEDYLPETEKCLIPDGIYEGIQHSDLIEVEIDDSDINLTLQNQGIIYNDPPVVPEPVLYSCQGRRLIVIYNSSEGRNTVFAGEWDENKNSIESMQRIETLVEGDSLNITLTPVQQQKDVNY